MTVTTRASNEGYAKVREDFTIMEKAATRAFSWLKAPTSTFTFMTVKRHCAKQVLTHVDMKLVIGHWSKVIRDGLVSIVSYSHPSFMTFETASQFHVYLLWGQCPFSIVS